MKHLAANQLDVNRRSEFVKMTFRVLAFRLSFKETGNKFEVPPNPLDRIILNFAKRRILSCLSQINNKQK